MQLRIGIYSGTFDPIHEGHISFASEVLRAGDIDEVIFLPEHRPRSKDSATDIAHRIAMIEQAIAAIPHLHILDIDDEQFSVKETLPKLRRLYNDADLTFLIGSDVARTLDSWQNIDTLIRDASFAIGVRANDGENELVNILDKLGEKYGTLINYTLINSPAASIASTHIRAGDMSSFHPATIQYIRHNNLYI